jgi:hypothetical protein
MLVIRPLRFALSLLVLPLFVQCSSGDGSSSSGSVQPGDYKGLVTTSGGTSVLEVMFSGTMATQSLGAQGASAGGQYAANGTSTPVGGGAAVTLTGSYDPATGKLSLSGTTSSGAYSFSGTASGSHLSGDYTSPSGSGTFSLLPAITGAVTLYCGTYSGDASGVWNVAVDATGTAVGGHCDGSECGALEGKVTDASVSLRDPQSTDVGASGSKSGSSLSGTWTGGGGQAHGTWQGNASGCGG